MCVSVNKKHDSKAPACYSGLSLNILAEFTAQFLQSVFLFLTDSLQLWILILQSVKLLRKNENTLEATILKQGANKNIKPY